MSDQTRGSGEVFQISERALAKHWDAIEAIRTALTRGIQEEASIGMTSGHVALGYSAGPR